MTVPATDRIEEFPNDGRLWWVRWVDRYRVPKGGTATPSVEVLLSRLDMSLGDLRNANLQEIVAPQRTNDLIIQAPIPIFTGFIPRLPIGLVFLDGIEVASLPLKHAPFDIREFSIAIRSIQDELPTKPSWWTYPYRVINRGDYHLGTFPDAKKSRAVVIESKHVVIVIPCHEIFRSMYAPHSDIARALTAGPWEYTKNQVVNPEGTGPRADGLWQVTLRPRIKDNFGDLLANLCISSAGKAAANGIYTGLLRNDGPGYMNAPMPFDFTRLQIEARGLWLDGEPRKFLALQLVAIEWPSSPGLVPFRDNSGKKGEIQTPVAKEKPYTKTSAAPSADEEEVVSANSQEDPLVTSAVTTFELPSVEWRNRPKQVEERKKESFIYVGRPRIEEERELEGVSPGTEWSGDTDSGSGAYSGSQQRRDVSQRLTEVVGMFDRLQLAGLIADWSTIAHPKPMLHAGALPLWHFPARAKGTRQILAFACLDRKEKQRRGALVCELKYNNHIIYWLEIEISPKESGRSALLYSTPKKSFIPATLQLLEIAALNQGKWLPADELMQFTCVSAVEIWTHSFVDKLGKKNGGRLNEIRALKAIGDVAEAMRAQSAIFGSRELPLDLSV